MRGTIRVTVLAAAALVALAFAGSAFASFAPKLLAKNGTAGVTVGVSVANADDATARVQIYVPSGYALQPPAPGQKLGDVTATAASALLGGGVLPLTGELDEVAQSSLTAAQVQSEQQCLLTSTPPAAVWNLHLTAAGQSIDIPMYVVVNSGVETTAGVAKLVVCIAPYAVSPANPFGAKLLSATFTTKGLTAPSASGDYRWTSVWTPYSSSGTPNAAGSVEAQSIVHQPTQAKLTVTKKKLVSFRTVKGKRVKVVKTQVKWLASATANGQPVSAASFKTTANGKSVGGKAGSFILLKGSATIATTATIPDQDLGATSCTPSPIFQGLPCIDATVGGGTFAATTNVTAYKS
jgi:hypothetical protein